LGEFGCLTGNILGAFPTKNGTFQKNENFKNRKFQKSKISKIPKFQKVVKNFLGWSLGVSKERSHSIPFCF